MTTSITTLVLCGGPVKQGLAHSRFQSVVIRDDGRASPHCSGVLELDELQIDG